MKSMILAILAATSLMFTATGFAATHTAPEKSASLESILSKAPALKFASAAFVMPAHAADEAAVTPAATTVKEPATIAEAAGLIPTLIAFAKNANWLGFGAVVTMLLTFLIRQFVLDKVGATTAWLPMVSAVLGILAGVGGAILAGGTPTAALLAVLSGPLASALWSAVMKYFFPAAPESVKA